MTEKKTDVGMKDVPKEQSLFEGQYRVKQINPKGKRQFYVHTLILEPVNDTKHGGYPRFIMDVCKRHKDQSYCDVQVDQIVTLTISRDAPKSGYRMVGILFKKSTETVKEDKTSDKKAADKNSSKDKNSEKTASEKSSEISHLFFSCGGLIVDLALLDTAKSEPFTLQQSYWFRLTAVPPNK